MKETYLVGMTLLATMIALVPAASAEEACTNSGVQVVVGDYSCQVQYCDNASGAGAGAGAGGPSQQNTASAGATAGTQCQQVNGGGDVSQCMLSTLGQRSAETTSVEKAVGCLHRK